MLLISADHQTLFNPFPAKELVKRVNTTVAGSAAYFRVGEFRGPTVSGSDQAKYRILQKDGLKKWFLDLKTVFLPQKQCF
jgi:hypothetical protein